MPTAAGRRARPAGASGPGLALPRGRPARPVDTAAREAFIARQRHPARRFRRIRRSLRRLGAAASGVLAVAALGVTAVAGAPALTTTPLLGVRRVDVVGLKRLPEGAVRSAARIEPGANLLALDVDALGDRLESLPGVRRAHVVRHLPDRVVLTVEEREPYALVSVSGADGGLFWADADGYLMGPERRPTAPVLPILSGAERPADRDHPVGDHLATGMAVLRAVQRAGGGLPRRISEIDLERPGGPVLYTTDGIVVWLGREAWEERLARLDAVLGEIEEHGEPVESVDLRFRDLVVWRPRLARATTGTAAQKER
jgi:cell division protein FtsQ